MASVPNLPIAPAVPIPGASGAPDADGAALDLFAQLLGGGPLIAVLAGPGAISGDVATLRAVPSEDDAESVDGEASPDGAATPADIIPLLQAQSGFPIAVAPSPPASAETAPVAVASAAKSASILQSDEPVVLEAPQMIKPDSDDISDTDIVGAAIKAVAEKLSGKPAVRAGQKSSRPTLAPEGTNAEANVAAVPSRPIESALRVEAAVQSAAPVTTIISSIPPAAQSPAPAAVQVPTANVAPAVADLVVERQLDLANDTQWLDRLARDIARSGAGDETLRFRLHPQTLGHLQVELSQSDRGANVRLTVETEAARNILIDAQPRLAAEARAQGVRLAGTEVDLGTAHQQSGDPRRNADNQAQDIVRVVRATQSETISSDPASGRSDRYA